MRSLESSSTGRSALLVAAALLTSSAIVSGCGSQTASKNEALNQEVTSVFELPDDLAELSGEHWLDHPWPSDFRRDPDGLVHLSGYPNPRHVPLIDEYLDEMNGQLDGFSPAAAGYVRFTGEIDPSTLPASPQDTLALDSSVQLIDVSSDSPEVGSRHLVTLEWHAEQGVYWQANTLGFMPTMGYPLRPHTTYAFVVTDALATLDGSPVRPSAVLRQVLAADARDPAAAELGHRWAGALQRLEEAGISKEHIVQLSIFTTSDPTEQTIRVAEDARTRQPTPRVDDSKWKLTQQGSVYDVYEGVYGPSPDYQAGTPPFAGANDGGQFVFDDEGRPIKQREFYPRFALSVPHADECPMPDDGYPVVMYAHGTGGNYKSFLNVTAKTMAERCLVTMGVDQIMHGDRLPDIPGKKWNVDLLFFNFNNPKAMRTNIRQSAVDEVVRARLLRESGIEIPASVSATGAPIRLSKTKIIFFGHSQGGLNGPLFMAIDDTARGGVLSGSGSMTVLTLLYKTKPQPSVAALTKTILLALRGQEAQELSPLHPGLSLVQTIADVVDPINYVPMLVKRPLEGHHPKSIYQTEGVEADFSGDSYTPPYAIEVQAIATGLPWAKPVIHQIDEARYDGLEPVEIPAEGLSGNLGDGHASGVLAQWHAEQASDGHFVVFDIPQAANQAAQFCRNLADDPQGRVPPR